ncbi:MAG: hypothetical protein K1X86_00190 [Ignavibacteria bacterium]|nr:hypothetical protein [Ignavibacteria bacterium]
MPNNSLDLLKVSRTLKEQAPFMRAFMRNYIFAKKGVPMTEEALLNKEYYERVIEFCLRTRNRQKNEDLKCAKIFFSENYQKFKELLLVEKDITGLQILVDQSRGVGQKIGSFIIEVFVHYILKDGELSKQLNVPLDTHVIRIFEEALLMNTPNMTDKINNKRYIDFQNLLKANSVDGNPIYFDYFWFIGKVFHPKINYESKNYSKGYRLCSMCWIKDVCKSKDKWE